MAYNFRVGEEKEVGVQVSAKDSSAFTLSGTWTFQGQSGTCNVDQDKVFFLCKPLSPGSNQKAELRVEVIPTDTRKLKEILKPQLTINVTP
jgi:hypothetical protein